jgi:ABC-type antimicrobial peptide transport system, ATPase component
MNIEIDNITVKIGADKTLFHIPRFELKQGTKLLIKGASGKGKTTFLHLLSGLFTPYEGRIQLGDWELTRMSDEERARFRRENIGIVFQKLNLIEHLTALENIELSLKDKKDFSRALSALKSVGLQERENDRTAVMSLGEQQRIAIARVLASDAKIVFADEPTSSLDEKNAFEVTELLISACKDKTLIVVSHDHRIEKYFDQIKDFAEVIA